MARLRRVVIEEDPLAKVADLARYRLRFSDEGWTYEQVAALSDAEVLVELDRIEAGQVEGFDGAA